MAKAGNDPNSTAIIQAIDVNFIGKSISKQNSFNSKFLSVSGSSAKRNSRRM